MRGLGDFKKRKTIKNWIMKQKADIIFLQETYSTPDIVTDWKYQWKGNMYFSHGSNESKGVLILIKKDIEFKLKNIKIDTNGRFIVAQCEIQREKSVKALEELKLNHDLVDI